MAPRMRFEGRDESIERRKAERQRKVDIRNRFYADQARKLGANAFETVRVEHPEGERDYLVLVYPQKGHARVHRVLEEGGGRRLAEPSREELEDGRFFEEYRRRVPYPIKRG